MTEELRAAFESHDEFAATTGGFEVTSATFDARVAVGDGSYRVTLAAPTLDDAVVGETVDEAVQEGWLDAFRRRVADVQGVTRTDGVEPPVVERDGETVIVDAAVEGVGLAPAEDARALVTFFEGTWFEGVVPGYDYREPVSSVRQRAYGRGSTGQ